jgi:spermidine synthase
VGGCLASAALILHLTASQIALLVALLNLVAAAMLSIRGRLKRLVAVFGILLLATILFPAGSRWLEAASLERLWRGFHLVEVRDTLYGNLAVVETEGSRSLYENGLAVVTQSDPEAAEEEVHFALLQHPLPRSLLLIGGGINGSVAEALKHPSLQQVDYVELDPGILEVGRRYFAEQWRNVADNPRVRIHNADGRLFVKSTGQKFDVVIVNLPDPQTAQLNRFYTAEFFQEARRILQPGGVFSFQLTGAENYISPQLADFLRSVHKTLKEVFPQVRALPGARIHFFASKDQGAITEDPRDLIARLRMRGIKTAYVREYYLPFRMSKERMADLASQLEPRPQTPVNRDFIPTAYYFNIALWSVRFQGIWSGLFQSLAKVPFAWLLAGTVLLWGAVSLLAIGNPSRTAALTVASMGFTQMGLEVFLLLAFQALCGYVYHQLALIIAGFMAGMALGSWWALPRAASMRVLTRLQGLGAASALVLWALFRIQPLPGPVLFPVLALFSGVMGGCQFTMAGKVFHAGREKGAGALYGIDLMGSVLGALLLSTFLVPVYGFFKTSLVIVAVNLVPAALTLSSSPPRSVPRRTPTL